MLKNGNPLFLLLCLTLFVSTPPKIDAQHAAKNWVFGQHARVDFNPTVPVATAVSTLSMNEGSSSISDSFGNLLFYTDGVKVWDKNHNQMPNGFGLLGHSSSTHSALIVPCSCSKYFIFTTNAAENGYAYGLRYSVVDMTLNGNLGDVMPAAKNLLLFQAAAEKVAAISDGSGGFWIVAHGMGDDKFFAYRIRAGSDCTLDPDAPKISRVGSDYKGGSGDFGQGQMKISPDATKLAVAGLDYGSASGNKSFIELFKFNRTTGEVSNYGPGGAVVRESNGDMFYGVEFSPDSKKLYTTTFLNNNFVYQYTILTNSLSPKTVVKNYGNIGGSSQHVGQLQLATDGRIYIARPNRTGGNTPDEAYLDALTTPNVGTGGFLSHAIDLASPSRSSIGLPTMIAGDFSCGPLSIPCCSCLGETITLDVSTGQGSSATDPYWKVNGLSAYVTPPDSPWLSLPPAEWLQPVALPLPSHNIPSGATYSYLLKFTVPTCTIPYELSLEGNVAGDNRLTFISPGGAITCPGPACYQAPQGPLSFNFAIASFPGVRTLVVAVRNDQGPSGMTMNARLKVQCKDK